MTHHLRKRAECGHRVVGVTLAEVEQDLLGVRPADAGQPGPGDHPIIVQRLRIGHLRKRDGSPGQVLGERVGVLGHVERLTRHAEDQRPHGRAIAAAPAMIGVDVGVLDVDDGLEVGHIVLEAVVAERGDDARGHLVRRTLGPS